MTVRAIGRYLRHKVTDFTDLILKHPCVTTIQALILAVSIRPNSNDGDESNINWYVYNLFSAKSADH